MMNRREALQLLATGAALQLPPGRLTAVLRAARAALATQSAPRTLNAHQGATVTAMAEMILPKTETPGATDVGVRDFIDLILTEWYDEEERGRFLAGLADVDTRSQALFVRDFIACLPAQQANILEVLGEKMIEEEHAREHFRRPTGSAKKPHQNFYFMFRQLTLTAYFTSEAGATEELHFQIIPDRHAGCVTADDDKGAQRQ